MNSTDTDEMNRGGGDNEAGGRADVLRAAWAGAAFLLLYLITPHLPGGEIAVLASTIAALAITLLLAVSVPRAIRSKKALFINLVLSCLLFFPAALLPVLYAAFPSPLLGRMAFLIWPYFFLARHVPGTAGLVQVWCAGSVGAALSRLVKEMKMLLPAAVVLACMDLYTVFGGGVVAQAVHAPRGHALVQKAAMKSLTVNLPPVKAAAGAAPIQLAVGFADYLFIAFFFACFLRFGAPSRNTFFALTAILVLYMLAVFLLGIDLPALVPIALVVTLFNFKAFRYTRSEAFALLYAGLALAAVLSFMILRSHSHH